LAGLSAGARLRTPGDRPRAQIALARLGARLIAHDLADVGIDIDCLPVLDVPDPEGHEVTAIAPMRTIPPPSPAFDARAAEGRWPAAWRR